MIRLPEAPIIRENIYRSWLIKRALYQTISGYRETYADIGKTIVSVFGLGESIPGNSFESKIMLSDQKKLICAASDAMKYSYAPYSDFHVGAALLCRDGSVYAGCNIESAAFSPTCCAERTALVKAVSEGKREFSRIAVVGAKGAGRYKNVLPAVCADSFFMNSAEEMLEVILSDGDR